MEDEQPKRRAEAAIYQNDRLARAAIREISRKAGAAQERLAFIRARLAAMAPDHPQFARLVGEADDLSRSLETAKVAFLVEISALPDEVRHSARIEDVQRALAGAIKGLSDLLGKRPASE